MIKKMAVVVAVVVAIVVLYFVYTEPPKLEWHDNSCWNNATFQLLRNVRPLTEELLKARKTAKDMGKASPYEVNNDGTPNEFMQSYVDLLGIVDEQSKCTKLEKESCTELEKKRFDFHTKSCDMQGTKGSGDAQAFVKDFLSRNKKLNKPWLQLLRKIFGLRWDSEKVDIAFYISLINVMGFQTYEPNDRFYELSDYIIIVDGRATVENLGGDISAFDVKLKIQNIEEFRLPNELDVTPYVMDELKKDGSWKYELIGFVCGAPGSGKIGHVWAYVKDQFEDKPKWWYVNDLTQELIQRNPSMNIAELGKFGSTPCRYVYTYLYKRIEPQTPVADLEKFAQALASVIR